MKKIAFCLYGLSGGKSEKVLAETSLQYNYKNLLLAYFSYYDNLINIKNINLVIAYEPIWAIGTGVNATSKQIDEVINWISEFLLQEFSIKVPILYGGSVTSSNCSSMLDIEKVSGFLIGTSSLDVNEFYSIYSIINER